MTKKVCILADTSNQFHTVGKKFPGRKLNYKHIWDMCSERGNITHAIAYCVQVGSNVAQKFVTVLKRTGFDVKIKTLGEQDRFTWYPEIAIDAATIAAKADEVIVLSSSPHMVPIVEHLKRSGINVHVIGCGINRELKQVANSFQELEDESLEVRCEASTAA